MGSDRARKTYDRARDYRSVVHQQGRVVLEADLNEAQEIGAEQDRAALLDVVGPAGTPDDGYRVGFPNPNPARDLEIGPGTFYLGGMRVALGAKIAYSAQPDWKDGPEPAPASVNELVFLQVHEQEISAVEDPALREVALGGVDTAQRVRPLQRIRRRAVTATTAAGALAETASALLAQGQSFDAAAMRLESTARLRVGIVPPTATPEPCSPVAQAGFLGAENQLIRVQISASNRMVWAFDNGSALYRATVTASGGSLAIQLAAAPVDAHHFPSAGQRVEIVRATAVLGGGDHAAALSGVVVAAPLGGNPYNPDTRTITVSGTVPPEFTTAGAATLPLFVRIWEEEHTIVSGTPIVLGDTGLQVTLQSGPFVVGDHWMFAARPRTPTEVYPPAYLTTPRPPDGPRRFLTPLALVRWSGANGQIAEDLRPPFDNLVELTRRRNGGCCTVTVRPEDLTSTTTLQSIIDQQRAGLSGGAKVNICLMPGTYRLSEPLRLGKDHAHLTLEGCHDGAVLEAAEGAEAKFLEGMVVMTYADDVTFRNLRFQLPQVDFAAAGGRIAGRTLASLFDFGLELEGLCVSIGVRPVHCANLRVQNCLFRFSLTPRRHVFGAGVFAGSECWGLTIENCRFLHKDNYLRSLTEIRRAIYGYLLAPSTTIKGAGSTVQGGITARALLNDAVFRNNLFSGLSAAALIYADIGVVRFEENQVRECRSGFWLIALRTSMLNDAVAAQVAEHIPPATTLLQSLLLRSGGVLARGYPPPAALEARHFHSLTLSPQTVNTLHHALLRVEQQRYLVQEEDNPRLHLSVHAADNDLHALVPAATSVTCFVLFGDARDQVSSTIVSSNRMTANGNAATACIAYGGRCAITGNLVVNDAVGGVSLGLYPGDDAPSRDRVAITGNVLHGEARLPPRNVTSSQSFPTWLPFNSQF